MKIFLNANFFDLMSQLGFIRTLARNPSLLLPGIGLRRYSIGPVFRRHRKIHGIHPKQVTECNFDILTWNSRSDLLPPAYVFISTRFHLNLLIMYMFHNTNICHIFNTFFHLTLLCSQTARRGRSACSLPGNCK